MEAVIELSNKKRVTFHIPEEGAIGSFMSGGADSSLMCYILADLIQKNQLKTKIYPITCEMLARPYNLRCASDVLKRITERTGFQFDLHLCYPMPDHRKNFSDKEKESHHGRHTRAFTEQFSLQTVFNGLTANPPQELLPDTLFAHRQTCRDDLNWRREQEQMPGLSVPFIHLDKKEICELYKKFDILHDIFPLTRSCEAELEETSYFVKDCFDVRAPGEECWWCLERAYGFGERVRVPEQKLIRETMYYGETEINASHEVVYKSLGEMCTIIPIDPSWKRVLIQVSGGLDSALLLYFVAKTFQDYGIKAEIIPLSLEVPTKAKTLGSARNVINEVRTLLKSQQIRNGIEVSIPVDLCKPPYKNKFFMNTVAEVIQRENIDFEMNGNTKNPPFEDRRHFRDDEHRELLRDARTTIYNSPRSASPHAFNDKKGIIHLYQKENLLNRLAPLTLSCDLELEEIQRRGLSIPCGDCWWCHERAWGFKANQLIDPLLQDRNRSIDTLTR